MKHLLQPTFCKKSAEKHNCLTNASCQQLQRIIIGCDSRKGGCMHKMIFSQQLGQQSNENKVPK
jgi:hypothetical protein